LTEPDPISGLSTDELAILGDALRALRRERGKAWNAACDIAEAQGKRPPPPQSYGINAIKRLGRRLGVSPTHWMEER